MVVVREDDEKCLLSISANGYGKRTLLNEDDPNRRYPVQNRGGKGVITMKTTRKTGPLVTIKGVEETDDLMIVTENGILIRTHVDGISTMGRNTSGVRVINIKNNDAIADVTRVVTEEDEAEEAASTETGVEASTNGESVEPSTSEAA
jgi:DNA gyrase subunit A